jgi:hypothetical protein
MPGNRPRERNSQLVVPKANELNTAQRSSSMSRQRKILCSAILLLYGVSFLLPVTGRPISGGLVDFYSGIGASGSYTVAGSLYGYEVFVDLGLGVISVIFGAFWTLVWLANPALWIGVVLLATAKWRRAWIAGCIGSTLGILAGGFIVSHGRDMHLYVGYYVWLGSIGLLSFSNKVLSFATPQGATP